MSSVASGEEDERPLAGGAVSGTVRVGDTVRRPAGSPAVRRVLRHLERDGFDGAPRLLGVDSKGRDVLSFMPGDVLIGQSLTVETVASAAKLIRRYHDAVAGIEVGGREAPVSGGRRVVCHNDLAPRNTIFRDGQAVALIDWDFVGMGPAVWDVAHAVWQFVLDHKGDQPSLLSAFLDGYGLELAERQRLLEVVVLRMRSSADGIDRRAATGEAAFMRLAALGAPRAIRTQAENLADRADLQAVLR